MVSETLFSALRQSWLPAIPVILTAGLLVPAAQAQNPSVDAASVVNAAHYITPDYPNGGIAHGGMFIVKSSLSGACGTKLASSFPLQTSMGGTSIKIAMVGASYDALMVYVVACTQTGLSTSDQLAAIMPSNVPVGTGSLTVTYNGKTSSPVPVKVIDRGFGMFTINQAGSGPAIVQNYNSATDTPTNTLANSAKPNQVAILWGTGLGTDGNPDANAPKPTDIAIPLELYVGGKPANIAYKGRSGCCAGIDQVVFTVPDGLSGCYVPVVVKIGDIVSNFGTMSVAPNGGACSDALGFTASDIQTAQSSNHLRVGFIDLIRQESVAPASPGATRGIATGFDEAFSHFGDLPFATLIGLPTRLPSVPGSCVVLYQSTVGGTDIFGPPMLLPTSSYKPGSAGAITFAGPKGTTTGNAPGTSDPYEQTILGQVTGIDPPDPNIPIPSFAFLDKGNVSISALGANLATYLAVGSISTQLNIPDVANFTNRYALPQVIDRTQGASVTWTGADAGGLVLITGTSLSALSARPGPHADFYCVVSGSTGQFTIPNYVLLSLPPSYDGQIAALQFGLAVGQVGGTRFNASGLDAGFVRYNITFGRSLGWK